MSSSLVRDFRDAARGLRRTPTVALAAIFCLALGIGATVAMWSAVSRALLQSLPFDHPEQLVAVHRTTRTSGPMGTWPQSVPNYLDLARNTRQLTGLAALTFGSALVETPAGTIQVAQIYVTANFFSVLGAHAERGRLLATGDDQPELATVSVISDEFWRKEFGADPSVVGRRVTIDGSPTTIVGVTPPQFRVPHGPNVLHADVWTPLHFQNAQLTQRRSNFLLLLGRIAPRATVQSAGAEIRGLFAAMASANPELQGEDVRVAELRSDSSRAVRTPLMLMFGAVVLVLLIAATNVSAILLARAVHRRREVAVRTALGATRWNAMRPALAESAIITIAGTAGGLAISALAVRTLGIMAAVRMPQLAGLTVDVRVAGFAVALAIFVGALCGGIPAWRGSQVDPQEALRGGRGGGAGREQHRALRTLVIVEIATSLVLLIGSGLVLTSVRKLARIDPGFEVSHLLTLSVGVPASQYPNGDGVKRFLEPALVGLRSVPGVEAAGAINVMPFINGGNNANIRYEGMPEGRPSAYPLVEQRAIDPNYFTVIGQRLIAGRMLAAADDDGKDTPGVAVVNQALVDRDLPGQNPIGRRFYPSSSSPTMATIVGVVSNVRNQGPFAPTAPEMYWSYRQAALGATNFPLMIRVRGSDPTRAMPGVRAALLDAGSSAAITNVLTMPDAIAKTIGRPRLYLAMLASFAIIALLLAAAGLYGVLSYSVAQRMRELGIRAALGGAPSELVELLVREGLRLVTVGLVIGYVGGAALTRLMKSLLFETSQLDPTSWVTAGLALAAVAFAATLVPALRAARADPNLAIRAE